MLRHLRSAEIRLIFYDAIERSVPTDMKLTRYRLRLDDE